MNSNFYNELLVILDKEKVYLDEPMKKHTTFKIGGNVPMLIIPESTQAICGIYKFFKDNGITPLIL